MPEQHPLFMFRIGFGLSLNDALCRADCRAGWRVRISNAFGAGCSIDDINIIAGRNRIDRTIWFIGSAVGTFFSNVECHIKFLA